MSLPILVQAHRGAGFLEAENCLEALELGWSLGMVPEIDVGTTRDGVIVGFHDKDLARLVVGLPAALRGRTLGEADWSELRGLNVGSVERPRRIPTIAEALDALRQDPRRLYLDIKRVAFPALVELVHEHDAAGQVIFSTNRDPWIAEWRSLLPSAETLRWVWMDDGDEGLARAERELAALRSTGFPGITQLQLHILVRPPTDGSVFHPGEGFIAALERELRGRGIVFQAFPHSGNPGVYRRLLDIGVRSFATDHPHELLAELQDWSA